jgi:DNA-binding CsgD family transcriptional regulator
MVSRAWGGYAGGVQRVHPLAPARRRVLAAAAAVTAADGFGRVLGTLAEAVPFVAGCWGAVDPLSLLPVTNGRLHSGGWEAMRAAWDNEYLASDMHKIRCLARLPQPVGVLSAATEHDLERSPRYLRVLRPMGWQHELRAALRVHGTCWGYLALFRGPADPDFSGREVAFVASVVPHLARALRTLQLAQAGRPGDGSSTPGLLVLADGGGVQAMNAQARSLLGDFGPAAADGTWLPDVVHAVALATRVAPGDETEAVPAEARLVTPAGRWLVVRGSRLTGGDGQAQSAILLEAARSEEVAPLVLRAFELTAREREVTLRVLRGLPTAEIAQDLVIAPYTVQDHLKAIFDKVGVRSRRELVGELFLRHTSRP